MSEEIESCEEEKGVSEEVNKWKAMQYRGRRREGSEEFLIEYYLLVHVLASSSTSA